MQESKGCLIGVERCFKDRARKDGEDGKGEGAMLQKKELGRGGMEDNNLCVCVC